MKYLFVLSFLLISCQDDTQCVSNNGNNTNNTTTTTLSYLNCRLSDGNLEECEAKGCHLTHAVVVVTGKDECIFEERDLCLSITEPNSTDGQFAQYCITNGQYIDSFALLQGQIIHGFTHNMMEGWTSCDTLGYSLCWYGDYLSERCGDGICQTFDETLCYWDCE